MSGINIYALRSPYSIRAMNDCVTEVVFVVDSERHTRSRCMWALCTVHCRRCRCARVMFTHSPLHTMNRLGWLCTNKQQTKNCKQLNLNTRWENTLWENTVWVCGNPSRQNTSQIFMLQRLTNSFPCAQYLISAKHEPEQPSGTQMIRLLTFSQSRCLLASMTKTVQFSPSQSSRLASMTKTLQVRSAKNPYQLKPCVHRRR